MFIQEGEILKRVAGAIGSIASVAGEVESIAKDFISDENDFIRNKGSVVINEAIKLVEYRRLDSGSTTDEPRVAACLGVLRELRRELAQEEQEEHANRDEDETNDAPAYAGV